MSSTTTDTVEARIRAAAIRDGLRVQKRRQPKGFEGEQVYRVFDARSGVQVFGADGVPVTAIEAFLIRRAAPIELEDMPPLALVSYRGHEDELLSTAARWLTRQRYLDVSTRFVLRARIAEWTDWDDAELTERTDRLFRGALEASGQA